MSRGRATRAMSACSVMALNNILRRRRTWGKIRLSQLSPLCSVALFSGILLSTSLHGVLAYDVYEDGLIEETIPGSAADSRGSPNSPFVVDSNRFSDGVSSVSLLSTTSPAFALYQNETENDTDERQREWAKVTMYSRLAQGVARRGAGNFEIAVARHNLLKQNYSNTENPSAVFPVNAWKRWNPSSFAIQQGETYAIGVPGEQYWQDGRIQVDSTGYEVNYDAVDACWVAVGRCRAYLCGSKPRMAPPRARWMQLVCGIGDFVTTLREATSGQERYLPISDEAVQNTLFPVGRNLTFVAEETGELVCFANDAEGLYGNNRAYLNVTVTRQSWPPNGTYADNYEAYVASAPTVRP